MPPRRSVHQRWIFFLQESPLHTPNILYDLNNVFNWTMTFRFNWEILKKSYGYFYWKFHYFFRIDSDIFTPYPVEDTTPGSVLELQIWNTTFNSNKLKNNVRRKKKLVAWFVSNCITTSGREKYVSELKKYVDVDVYGACGTLTCSNHIECCKYIIDSIPANIMMFRHFWLITFQIKCWNASTNFTSLSKTQYAKIMLQVILNRKILIKH